MFRSFSATYIYGMKLVNCRYHKTKSQHSFILDICFLPVDKLLYNFHPSIQLIEGQDVLLSEETQARAFSKILQKKQNEQKVTK